MNKHIKRIPNVFLVHFASIQLVTYISSMEVPMNKSIFSRQAYYRLIRIGIVLFLAGPINLAIAIFFEGPPYQWPFRLFFVSLSLIGMVLGFLLFWYLVFASLFYFFKKDKEKARSHLVHFAVLALLPLLYPLIIYGLDFILSGFQVPPHLNFSSIYYPAGGQTYTRFFPLVLEECKNILTDPSYTIPIG